jgi:hypothetical protein
MKSSKISAAQRQNLSNRKDAKKKMKNEKRQMTKEV